MVCTSHSAAATGLLRVTNASAEAIAAKAGTSCYWTLRLAERMCGLSAPAGVLERLAPPTPEWVRRALERHFVAGIAVGEAQASPSLKLTRLLWRSALRPR